MNKSRWKKFLSYYKPYLGEFSLVILASLTAAAAGLMFPLFAQHIADTAFGETASPVSSALLIGMLALAAVELTASYWKDVRGHALGAKMENALRQELFAHLQKLPFSFYDKHPVGDLMSRLTGDLEELSELYHHGPEDYVVNAIRCVGALAILFSINVSLAWLMVVFMLVLALFTVLSNKWVGRAAGAHRARMGDINAQAEEWLSGVRTVQAFTQEAHCRKGFERLGERFCESRIAVYRTEGIAYQGMSLLSRLIMVAVIFVGGLLAVRGRISTAGFVVFLLYIGNLTEPVRQLGWMSTQLNMGLAGFCRVMDILEITPHIADGEDAVPAGRLNGRIEFQHVSFAYEQGRKVLSNINMIVEPGETVALVGASGIGKTTMLSLIPRFYEAQEGCILMDGCNVRQYTLHSLRDNIAMVRQDGALFSGSVADNIRIGKPDTTMDDVVRAAKLADADGFIRSLPDGYDSDIGPRGVRLSGGQKQRICIARAFLKDAPILLLDEATSALDSESEREIQRSLNRLTQGRTTLVAAHRLSTIRHADRIVVLGDAGICEQGTHQTLMELDCVYAALYRNMA